MEIQNENRPRSLDLVVKEIRTQDEIMKGLEAHEVFKNAKMNTNASSKMITKLLTSLSNRTKTDKLKPERHSTTKPKTN